MNLLTALPRLALLSPRVAYQIVLSLHDLAARGDGWSSPKVWSFDHEVSGRPVVADIVLIHGIGGDHIDTWLYEDQARSLTHLWPIEIPNMLTRPVRILSIEYGARLWRRTGGADQSLADAGLYVADTISEFDIGSRPTIFVCHSLGGLVIKAALVADSRRSGSLCSNTLGVLFFGTPHKGSNIASLTGLLEGLSGLRWRSRMLEIMKRDFGDGELARLDDDFHDWVVKRYESIKFAAFAEERFAAIDQWIVDKDSAHGRFSAMVDRAEVGSIPADHVSMVKFPPESPVLRRTAGLIERWLASRQSTTVPVRLPPKRIDSPETLESLLLRAADSMRAVQLRGNLFKFAVIAIAVALLASAAALAYLRFNNLVQAGAFVRGVGISGGYSRANDYLASEFRSDLSRARHDIMFFGTDFHISAADQRNDILDALCRGVRVRYLVADPEGTQVGQLAIHFGSSIAEMQSIMRSSLASIQELKAMWKMRSVGCASQGDLSIHLFDEKPTFRGYFFDTTSMSRYYVVPYINRVDAPNSFGFFLSPSSGIAARAYLSAAEKIWNDSREPQISVVK